MDLQSVTVSPSEVQKTVVLLRHPLRCWCLVLREGFRWPGPEWWLRMSRPGNRSRPGRWRIAVSGKSWVCPWSGLLKSLCWIGRTYWFLKKTIFLWINLLILHKGDIWMSLIMVWHVTLPVYNRDNLLIFFLKELTPQNLRHSCPWELHFKSVLNNNFTCK